MDASAVESVRRFNRFYTKQIGLLQETLLRSSFSLSEARVLYELAHRENLTASELAKDLGLDAGYLSRLLASFENRGLLKKKRAESDARQSLLLLTAKGRRMFAAIDARSSAEVAAMLDQYPATEQNRLLAAMKTIEELLGARSEPANAFLLRPHQPGDMGWVVHRHGLLYAEEYGWDETFEALVAEIVAKFIRNFDPKRERCWIAERDGEIAGSVFLVKESTSVAKLRLLLVEPRARGLGIGRRLVEECIRFARQAGYCKITLWTNNILIGARRIYDQAGFLLVEESPHHSFGHDLVGQYWELDLRRP
jgi:DNA-binding MarR family transcriptional regulator/GNAT superfamily N-acetyltransferase